VSEIYHVKQYNYRFPFAWKIVNSHGTLLRVVKYMHEDSIFRLPAEDFTIKKLDTKVWIELCFA